MYVSKAIERSFPKPKELLLLHNYCVYLPPQSHWNFTGYATHCIFIGGSFAKGKCISQVLHQICATLSPNIHARLLVFLSFFYLQQMLGIGICVYLMVEKGMKIDLRAPLRVNIGIKLPFRADLVRMLLQLVNGSSTKQLCMQNCFFFYGFSRLVDDLLSPRLLEDLNS